MKYNNVIFDLDGTLTDSKPGIIKSLKYAFEKMDIKCPDEEILNSFIGPPLWDSFKYKLNLSDEAASEGLKHFRTRFQPIGIYENCLYPNVKELLHSLYHKKDIKVYLATAKPEESAKIVLDYFKIRKYFTFIKGATFDGRLKDKSEIISFLIKESGIDNIKKTVMIGDRDHDVLGASQNGIESIGVLYGYGNMEELTQGGATQTVESVLELRKLLLGN